MKSNQSHDLCTASYHLCIDGERESDTIRSIIMLALNMLLSAKRHVSTVEPVFYGLTKFGVTIYKFRA